MIARVQDKPRRILRPKDAMDRLGVKRTCFDERFIKTGRLRKIKITDGAVGFLEADVDALIAEIANQEGFN